MRNRFDRQLQQLNNELIEMGSLIERAIDRQGGAAFLQAKVIGEVLGRDRPGVGDGFLALRMEKMIERGTLCVVTEAPSDAPGYHRMLRQPTS